MIAGLLFGISIGVTASYLVMKYTYSESKLEAYNVGFEQGLYNAQETYFGLEKNLQGYEAFVDSGKDGVYTLAILHRNDYDNVPFTKVKS